MNIVFSSVLNKVFGDDTRSWFATYSIVDPLPPTEYKDKDPGEDGSYVHYLQPDVVTAESWNRSVDVTRLPIERSSEYIDHAVKNPDDVSFTCLVSETPMTYSDYLTKLTALKEALNTQDDDDDDSDDYKNSGESVYITKAKNFLDYCLNPNTLIVFNTSLGRFENYKVTSVSINRTAENLGLLVFSIEAAQVKFVDTIVETLDDLPSYNEGATLDVGKAGTNPRVTSPIEAATKDLAKADSTAKRKTMLVNALDAIMDALSNL